MKEKLRKLLGPENSIEDRAFAAVLFVGATVCLISAIVTAFEKIGIYATVFTVITFLLFIMIAMVNYKLDMKRAARMLLCYLINCLLMPVLFFACGGIDSGMPIYFIAGVFIIIPLLEKKQRVICFVITLLVQTSAIGLSYSFMEGTKGTAFTDIDILADLTLEGRIIDVISSYVLVAIFMGIATLLILVAYQQEREKTEKLNRKLEEFSRTDELTGLFNRRELFNFLENNSSIMTDDDYYVSMIDIDRFKVINDVYGHGFGDTALRTIAGEMKKMCDSENGEIAARYGGEEFLIVFREKSSGDALAKVEKLRRNISGLEWRDDEDLSITVSAGLMPCKGSSDVTHMLADVDKLLYEAKHTGRDKTVMKEEK